MTGWQVHFNTLQNLLFKGFTGTRCGSSSKLNFLQNSGIQTEFSPVHSQAGGAGAEVKANSFHSVFISFSTAKSHFFLHCTKLGMILQRKILRKIHLCLAAYATQTQHSTQDQRSYETFVLVWRIAYCLPGPYRNFCCLISFLFV